MRKYKVSDLIRWVILHVLRSALQDLEHDWTRERPRMVETCHSQKENLLNRAREMLVFLLFSPLLFTPLKAATNSTRTLYVSRTGSDSNPGTWAKPFLTIQHAVGDAKPGDTINVRGGTFCEKLAPTTSGDAAKGYIPSGASPAKRRSKRDSREPL